MKITLISTFFPPMVVGGAEVNAYLLAQFLAQAGHDVEVITGARLLPKKNQFKIVYTPSLTPDPALIFEPFWAKKTARYIKSLINPDRIYHSFDLLSHLVLHELKLPKSIMTMQDVSLGCKAMTGLLSNDEICRDCSWRDFFRHHSLRTRGISSAAFGYLIRCLNAGHHRDYLRQNVRYVTTLTYFLKDYLHLKQATVIPDLLMPPTNVRATTASNQIPTVLIVGRLGYDKGTDLILQALKTVNFRTIFIGNGLLKYWLKYAKKLGIEKRVQLIGQIAFGQVGDWYNQADLVVSASRLPEASSRTILEAMSIGKAVVAPAFGGPAEIITNSQNGFLFERGNSEALARAIESAYQNRKQIGAAAWDFSKRYLPEEVVPRYLDLYGAIGNR